MDGSAVWKLSNIVFSQTDLSFCEILSQDALDSN